MNQYNAIEEQPVLETPNKSPSTSIKKLVAASRTLRRYQLQRATRHRRVGSVAWNSMIYSRTGVLASFALGACAATAISYRAAGVTDLVVTDNCGVAAGLYAVGVIQDQRAATAESACSPFILPAPASTIGKCPADPGAPVSMGAGEYKEAVNPEKIVISGAMCGGTIHSMYGVQENVWVKGPMMGKAKIEINGVGVGGDLVVQGTMTDDASIFIDAGGGVRNLIVQAEMSGNAKITVVGEVSGGITVASMSGNAKIQAGSCGKPTTKTSTITGSAAITGTGC